ncbi:class I SAM-dependent methyltransferase [Terriglobus aquaticus]|uniref:class I SAM-dependent methyltransferase n=1 Tax=Terriglobus aquaticus TaxID=940139 RepID=UPI0021E045AD|nr:methyltransferase domain-containing protein [Terriglobus aquaticus]
MSIGVVLSSLLVAFSLAGGLFPVRSQTGGVPPQHPTSTPYTGSTDIFEYPDRARKLQIDRVMNILQLGPGKTVADLGAGGGWFSMLAARRVAPNGMVFAEDINPTFVSGITQRAMREGLRNVKPVLGTPTDPRLPDHSVDAVLMLKVYHEIADTAALLGNLKPALKPGARVGIIDRNGNGADHGLKQSVVEAEMHAAGYREIEHYTFTKADGQDYFLVFVVN